MFKPYSSPESCNELCLLSELSNLIVQALFKSYSSIGEQRQDCSALYLCHKSETVDKIGEHRQDGSDLYLCHKSETVAAMYYVYLVS